MVNLIVGDVHAQEGQLEECQRLIDLCYIIAKKYKVFSIIFMGDQCHTHNLVYNSVLEFWGNAFEKLESATEGGILVLVGNHDLERGRTAHSMMYFKGMKNVGIIDKPEVFFDMETLCLPHIGNNEEFVKLCNEEKYTKNVLCHEEFKGGKYDNGFYIPNGIDPVLIPQKKIISGHIHTAHEFGKVKYIGSPRWLTLSDANQEKFIYVTDLEDEWIKIPTKSACSPIYIWEDHEENPGIPCVYGENDRITVDIHGSEQYINLKQDIYHKRGFKTRTFITKDKKIKVKESEGVINAFNSFLGDFKAPNSTSIDKLTNMSTERIKWTN